MKRLPWPRDKKGTLPAGERISVADEYTTTYFAADPETAALTIAGPDDATIDGCVGSAGGILIGLVSAVLTLAVGRNEPRR